MHVLILGHFTWVVQSFTLPAACVPPAGAVSNSQSWFRFLVNTLLWLFVLLIKILFDFFLVLKPLATGPVAKIITRAEAISLTPPATPADVSMIRITWLQTGVVVFGMWAAVAFLVFYDTGLFWQVVSAIYSTLVLGLHQRIGQVK
jgi:hypothetical protein